MIDPCIYRNNLDLENNTCYCANKMIKVQNGSIPTQLCQACPWKSTIEDPNMLRPSGFPIITVSSPGLVQMAQNFGKSMLKQAGATLAGKPTFVPSDVYKSRLEICGACEYFKKGRCTLCGCNSALKTQLSTSVCPDNPPRWGEWQPPSTGVL